MEDAQVLALMVCLFRVAERLDHVAQSKTLKEHIEDAQFILEQCYDTEEE